MGELMLVLAGACVVGIVVTTLADRADGCWICDYDPDCRLCDQERPEQGE